MEGPLVGIIMGSKSDWETMRHASETLVQFGVSHECKVVSAHRTPEWMAEYASSAAGRGLAVIIAGAGGAAHLPGMIAAHTTLPVLGVPVESAALKGLDSLLSIVQMPGGVPVATFAIGKPGAINAALLAVSILAARQPGSRRAAAGLPRRTDPAGPRRNASVTAAVLPGSTIGVLGSGQLGRMFAIAARRMGYRVHTFSPDDDTPTGQVADVEITAPYEDLDAVRAFAAKRRRRDVRVRERPGGGRGRRGGARSRAPGGSVLAVTQHRLREKTFLSKAGFPVTTFAEVRSLEDLQGALSRIGCPAVLKTSTLGYDGKGQSRIDRPADAARAWETVAAPEAILEGFVAFEKRSPSSWPDPSTATWRISGSSRTRTNATFSTSRSRPDAPTRRSRARRCVWPAPWWRSSRSSASSASSCS